MLLIIPINLKPQVSTKMEFASKIMRKMPILPHVGREKSVAGLKASELASRLVIKKIAQYMVTIPVMRERSSISLSVRDANGLRMLFN